ncbi:25357_t:CDS:2, partial [Racocetra persica]
MIGSENDFCDLSQDWFIIKANLNETLQEAHIPSLRFFQDVARCPRKTEDLSPEEDQWIRLAYIGGLTWAEPYEGIATELDFNEYYLHILAYRSTCWPIGGQPASQKYTRTFYYNPAGYYTHHDIQMAIDLGLHIELSSESPNALIFGPNQLMRGDEIFYQWASYLTEIKHEGGQADRRRPGPHRCMAPFILAKGRKTVSEKIRSLGDRIKHVHTDGFILSEWTNFEEIILTTSTKLKESTICYVTAMPNEIFERIFQYHSINREKISISRVKFTNALSKNTKPKSCEQVLSLKFIGTINIGPDVYISEVCKACANLQQLSFENCGSRIINNKNLEALLVECPNLKSLAIRGSRRLSPRILTKIPKLTPNLETIEI